MSLPNFDRVQFTGTSLAELARQGNALSERLVSFLRRLSSNTALDYVEQSDVVLTGGVDVALIHKLGRVAQGWQIVDINAAATIFRNAAFNASTLTLRASATCTVKVRVW